MDNIFLIVTFALACAYFLYRLLQMYLLKRRIDASRVWPQTAATVTESQLRSQGGGLGNRHYSAVIAYTYRAFGAVHSGKLRRDAFSNSKAVAEQAVAENPPGALITVRYNPVKPEESFAEQDQVSQYDLYGTLALFIFVLVWGISALFF